MSNEHVSNLREIKSKEAKELINKYICLRESKGLLASNVASITGMGKSVITRTEKGLHIPKVDTLLMMLDAIGYTLTIEEKENEAKANIKKYQIKKD